MARGSGNIYLFNAKWFMLKLVRLHWIFLFLVVCGEAKQPQLAPRDVKVKVGEILKAHASHKVLTPELMRRVFSNFLEELDPSKTYFVKSEILQWVEPSDALLQEALAQFQNGDFSVFSSMHDKFVEGIARRALLEKESASLAPLRGVKSEEFKNLTWANDTVDLSTRLHRIRSLQAEAIEKLDAEAKLKFFQRVEKKKSLREAELSESNDEERSRLIMAYTLKAIAASLDAHTNYFTPTEASQFMIQVQQRLFGIGAQLRDDLDGLSVQRIIENSPASQSNKIKLHDKIIAVNREPIVGMDMAEAVELIRGEQGTPVALTILRESEEGGERKVDQFEVELVRGEVILEESRLETILEPFGDGVIAHLKLFSFYQDAKYSSAGDIRKALERVQDEHKLKGVILDMRGNGGGFLGQAVSVTGLFIRKGIVVSVQDNTGKVQHLRETEGNPIWTGPLVVLVNRASASATEIVAQTLQDYGRAIVLGDDFTFGKGSFQICTLDPVSSLKINPQGEYKVTRGRYYTVSGKSPQLVGVRSDIVIPGILSEIEIGEKYGKFPLETDTIKENFIDDLSDLSMLHRFYLGSSYLEDLQPKLETYLVHVDNLKYNSNFRIQNNKNYQAFLEEIKKKNFDSEIVNIGMQTDFQALEAMNVMKDLLFFLDTGS